MPAFGRLAVTAVLVVGAAACASPRADTPATDNPASQARVAARTTPAPVTAVPAGATTVAERLAASPRHGEWVMVSAGAGDSVRAWVVYPERRDRAPIVLVVHEIFGLSTWIRGVADQLAADGFIAIAPDLLTGKAPLGPGDSLAHDVARTTIRTLDTAEVHRRLDAVARFGMGLPAALPRYGIVGFCWGGSTSFAHAVHSPTLGAAVVYYGGSPPSDHLARVRAPVLGLYAGNDARVNATVPPADSTMRALGKPFEVNMFDGSGHGFLRAQGGDTPANDEASRAAWPLTIGFFRRHLGG